MQSQVIYTFVADTLLVSHVLFVAFVVFGFVFIVVGKFRPWRWIRNPWLRITHLLSIGIVAGQSWFGIICPLTRWEMTLRSNAGQIAYDGSFITHWLNVLLYYQAPQWVFVMGYSVFAGLVLASWFWVKPREF